jgi:hypothetical protein
MILHRQFFGDADRDFALTFPLITELERTTGTGIGSLCRKLARNEFAFGEITETVRLALIGGGAAPIDASALTQTYVANRPLFEGLDLALTILNTLYFGPPAPAESKQEPINGPD